MGFFRGGGSDRQGKQKEVSCPCTLTCKRGHEFLLAFCLKYDGFEFSGCGFSEEDCDLILPGGRGCEIGRNYRWRRGGV